MAENENTEYEHEIAEKLKRLNAQIKVPEMPDAQTVFEKAKSESKSNVKRFKWSKISTVAAAVVILCIAVPLAIHNPFLKTVSKDAVMENNMGAEANDSVMMKSIYGGTESGEDEIVESVENTAEIPMMMNAMPAEAPMEPDPEESAQESAESCRQPQPDEDDDSDFVKTELSDYFYGLKSMNMADGKIGYVSESVSHFEDKLSKKRSIEVDINDSVSVILYDTSGETEILSEFWVEGTYITSNFDGETYIIEMYFAIDEAEFESGDYLPLIGDSEKGTYQLSEEDLTVEEEITEAIIHMAVKIDVENGSYTIDAILK